MKRIGRIDGSVGAFGGTSAGLRKRVELVVKLEMCVGDFDFHQFILFAMEYLAIHCNHNLIKLSLLHSAQLQVN